MATDNIQGQFGTDASLGQVVLQIGLGGENVPYVGVIVKGLSTIHDAYEQMQENKVLGEKLTDRAKLLAGTCALR